MSLPIQINERSYEIESDPDTPLLWVLRDELRLMGTKYGCGQARCGACTVLVDGVALRSCVAPVASLAGRRITTIEGLGPDHPVQRAWIEAAVPQCGYCQSGQVLAAVALLERIPRPTDAQIDRSMAGNACRCGTYVRIRAAIHRAAPGEDAPGEEAPGEEAPGGDAQDHTHEGTP